MSGRFLLVGWEDGDQGILHPLVDQDLPVLGQLIETGASGPLSSPRPAVGAAQWVSLATGKRAWQHGVCVPLKAGYSGPEPVDRSTCRATPVWEILDRQGLSTIVAGWPATHGSRNQHGVTISDRFHVPTAPPGQPWPPAPVGTYGPDTFAEALDPLRVHPEEIGTDMLSEFVPDWRDIDQTRDTRLARLRILLAADFSYHAAVTAMMSELDWSLTAVRYRAIGEMWRLFGRDYCTRSGPFQRVIPTMYRMLDQMLKTLMSIADPDTEVMLVTPNGIDIRARDAESFKSPPGIFAIAGRDVRADELVHGASALDITPTILHRFGLPVGNDMEGRVLEECFASKQEPASCESWDSNSPAPPEDSAGRDYEWNRARSCLDGNRPDLARPILEKLFREFPEHLPFAETLFKTQLALGLLDDARSTLTVLQELLGTNPAAQIATAELAVAAGDTATARETLATLLATTRLPLGISRRAGLLLFALRDWPALASLAKTLIEHDDRDELAWLGYAEASLRLGDAKTACAAAQQAIRLKFFLPEAHLTLSRALAKDGMPVAAIQAAERLLEIHPGNRAAAAYLRRLRRTVASPAPEARDAAV